MNNFETLLKEKGLTKTAFSKMLGIKKQNLNSLLKNPTLETIKKIATALNCSVADLFTTENRNTAQSDLTALIHSKGSYYSASTLKELKAIVTTLEQQEEK